VKPLADHLVERDDKGGLLPCFLKSLLARGSTEQYASLVVARMRRVIEGCEFKFWGDISASGVQAYLDDLRADKLDGDGHPKPGMSARTFNFYLQAVKHFCRWMVKDRRANQSPVEHLEGVNVRTDRRHDRRALSVSEVRRLLAVARTGPEVGGMTGPVRATLYRLATETGLRVAELRSLSRGELCP
jgi:site-specific recombinase XerD